MKTTSNFRKISKTNKYKAGYLNPLTVGALQISLEDIEDINHLALQI